MSPERVSVGEEGQSGPKTEKMWEPTTESLVRGIWRLMVSKVERRVQEGV